MKWGDLDDRTVSLLRTRPPPDILVIQLGSNDLTTKKSLDLIHDMECSFHKFNNILQKTTLVWSMMLPRCYWHTALKPAKIEKARKIVSSRIKSTVTEINGKVIRHPQIVARNKDLYRHDGTHLSNAGNNIYSQDIKLALECFMSSRNNIFPAME